MKRHKPHSKIFSIISAILLPGAGHFYVGHVKKGLLLLVLLFTFQYFFIYMYTFYVNYLLVIFSFMVLIGVYIYGIYNPIQIINNNQNIYKKYHNWAITLFLYIPILYLFASTIINYIPLRTFSIPAKSMENTVLKGDSIIVKKSKQLSRGQLSVFLYPKQPTIYYLKRCVAVEDDEIIYINKKLLIHFHEGDTYIKEHYPSSSILKINKKLWVINPYMLTIKGIHYKPNYDSNSYKLLISYSSMKDIGMQVSFFPTLKSEEFIMNHKKFNAFYTKVKPNHYFMMGDNRDNSNDSRFWGSVDKNLLFGKPSTIYFHLSEDFSIDWTRIGIKLNKTIQKDSI